MQEKRSSNPGIALVRAGEMTGSFSEPTLFYCELQPPRWAPWNVESEQFHGLSRERLAESRRPAP